MMLNARACKLGSNPSVHYIFGCAQAQSIGISVQLRAANIGHRRYVFMFYIFLCGIHTQIYNIQTDS